LGGKLLSEQAQSLQAGSLNNDQGSIGSRAGLKLDSGVASNRGGEILSLGDAELKLASLDNAGGKLHSNGKLELRAEGDILSRKGQISALKQLELHSQGGKLDSQGGKTQDVTAYGYNAAKQQTAPLQLLDATNGLYSETRDNAWGQITAKFARGTAAGAVSVQQEFSEYDR
ncbi:hypothetical protein C3L29_035675, partial [Pseudomonas sp. MWU12-2534b]